jgi:hypothetical protein
MTNLMQQLQEWADAGRYDFENKTFNSEGIDFKSPSLIFPFSKNYSLDKLYPLVLNGTIQVWRPVEHYDVPCKEKVRKNPQNPVLFLHVDSTKTLETSWHWCESLDGYIYTLPQTATHWMPIPAPPKEGE